MRVCQQDTPPFSSVAFLPSPSSTPESSIRNSDTIECSLTAGHHAGHRTQKDSFGESEGRSRVTINMLPDDALLEIFHSYTNPPFLRGRRWQGLVQVCQRWRNLVFGSPRFLNLQLHCTAKTPVRTMLDVWPALPITVLDYYLSPEVRTDNILAALEHHDRIYEIVLYGLSSSFLEQVVQVAQKPFPMVTNLRLSSYTTSPPVLPDTFLGGFAPRLRTLIFDHIPSPALPNLLLSATNLCCLKLLSITLSGYISPQVMVSCLSAMTRLDELVLEFDSPQAFPNQPSLPLPPPTRAVLPALVYMRFRGICGYLEDLVAGIDAPILRYFIMSIFNQPTFNTPQLFDFISRTNQLRSPCQADVIFRPNTAIVELYPETNRNCDSTLELEVLCGGLSSLAQLCSSSLSSLSTLERLDIRSGKIAHPDPPDNIENAQWLELVRPFVAVKNLRLVEPLGVHVMSVLREFAGNTATGVLPRLRNIYLEEILSPGPLQEAVGQFIAARQLSGHTVTVHHWEKGPNYPW